MSTPSVKFNPALSVQRQGFILESLRQVKPKSVLDIGCGEGQLLECLVRCDDFLPIEVLAGIDVSLTQLESAASIIIQSANFQQEEGRWHSLDIVLLQGSFTKLTSDSNIFEAVISSEVIEHLDPEEHGRYWDIHLGLLQPNTLIVTTPNRDFNDVFETVEKITGDSGRSYRREGVPYRMRHEDHRFEYTKIEFEEKARRAAKLFGYQVSFTGVGTPQNAFRECPDFLDKHLHFKDLGYCSQAAIFTRLQLRELPPSVPTVTAKKAFQVVSEEHYPRNVFVQFPPSPDTLADQIGGMWREFRPRFFKDPTKEMIPSACAHLFDAAYDNKEDLMICRVPLAKLWDLNYTTEKLFRFNKDVYMEVGEKLEHKEFDHEFVGLESAGVSMKGFRFSRIEGEMHVIYEYYKDIPQVVMPEIEDSSTDTSISSI